MFTCNTREFLLTFLAFSISAGLKSDLFPLAQGEVCCAVDNLFPLVYGDIGGVAEDLENEEEDRQDWDDDKLSMLLDVSRCREQGASFVSDKNTFI